MTKDQTNFDQRTAEDYDDWYKTGFGKYSSELEEKLMLEFLKPEREQTLLDIGCGTGRHLLLFKNLGMKVVGIDSSINMLEKAKRKVGEEYLVHLSDDATFPFDDKSFDLSIIFLVLEFSKNPVKLLKEARRVTKRKIFIGFLNRHSFLALSRRIKGLFRNTAYKQAKFFTLSQVQKVLKNSLSYKTLSWKGAIFLPWINLKIWQKLDYKLSFIQNSFCAFIGVLLEL